MVTISSILAKDGINWYYERQGSGPHLILIPSGEGDCGNFAKTATLLAASFTVTTFDMPGMSRTTAPISEITNVTGPILAQQVANLMDALDIEKATFYGCSSGALAALYLAINHSHLVQSIIIHEAPLHVPPPMKAMLAAPDEVIVHLCTTVFSSSFNADFAAWEALGPDYHARLAKNWVVWIRGYIPTFPDLEFGREELTKRPVTWTVGGRMELQHFGDNVVQGTRAGLEVGVLDCKHFPQVSMPEGLAEHIRRNAEKYL